MLVRAFRPTVFVLVLLTAPSAHAQSQHIESEIRAQQAREATARNELSDAVRLYRQSLALDANPRAWQELARVYETRGELRLAADAWTHYATTARTPGERDRAIVRREQLRRRASLVRVRVGPVLAAREARVWFDRDPPRPVPAGGAESLVEGGSHRVRVESPGYAPFETMVPTAYGEPVELVARLRPAAANGDTVGAAPDAR